MVQLVIDDAVIPEYESVQDVPKMNPGSIVKVKNIGYFVEDGS